MTLPSMLEGPACSTRRERRLITTVACGTSVPGPLGGTGALSAEGDGVVRTARDDRVRVLEILVMEEASVQRNIPCALLKGRHALPGAGYGKKAK